MAKKTINNDVLLANIIKGIEEVKGNDIDILDLREIDTAVCDYFIVCNGNSNTQVNAIVNSIQKTVSKELKDKPWHVEGTDNAEWVLMDYVNIVVMLSKNTFANTTTLKVFGVMPKSRQSKINTKEIYL